LLAAVAAVALVAVLLKVAVAAAQEVSLLPQRPA
jgi:hypothetical protein